MKTELYYAARLRGVTGSKLVIVIPFSERDAVEPITKLKMSTLKRGEPIEKGMRLSGLEIMFAQPDKGFYLVQPGDHVKITRGVPSPTSPTSLTAVSATAALPARTRE